MLLISITVLRAKVQLLRHEVFSCLKHLNKEKNREKVLRNTIPDQVRHGFNISGKCKDLAQIFYKEACSEAPTQSVG